MKRMFRNTIIAVAAIGLSMVVPGCTDAQMAKVGALGDPAHITCYSGGKLVLDDFSTGKVSNSENSDGFYYKSVTTGRLQEASGDCQLDYGVTKPANFAAVLPAIPVTQ